MVWMPRPSPIPQTLMSLMRKLMLNFCHFWTHGLMKGKGNWGGAIHSSCCLWPWSQLCCSTQPCSWCTYWGPSLNTSHCSAAAGRLAGHGDKSWLWKLNGVDAGGMEWGGQDPWCDVSFRDGLVDPHQSSPRLTGLVLSWACLLTQLMAPDKVNMASHTLPKLSSSSNDCYP